MPNLNLDEFMAQIGSLTHIEFMAQESMAQSGVKGMKWGQRKAQSAKGPIVKGTGNKTLGRAKTKAMSDDQLKKRIARLNMEKQYKELTKTQTSLGRKFVNEVLTTSGKTIATKYATEYGDKAVAKMIGQATKLAAKRAISG